MTLDEIQEALTDKRLYLVADKTDLSYPTIKKLADGAADNYSLDTIQRVSDYLRGEGLGAAELKG